MGVNAATALCPALTVLPYDFVNIQRVSEAIFDAFLRVTPHVMAVSCDEAYLVRGGDVCVCLWTLHRIDERAIDS